MTTLPSVLRGPFVALALLAVVGGVARAEEPDAAPTAPQAARPTPSGGGTDLVATASSELSLYSDTDAVTVVTPTIAAGIENPLSEWSVNARYLVDVVSAASVDIVSTASRAWHEVRHEGNLDGQFKIGDVGFGANGAVSMEGDYQSWALGGRLSYDFADKNVTALVGYAFGHDVIGKTDTPFSFFSNTVIRHSFNGAVNVVLNRSTLLALVGDAIIESGDQSKPYRYVPMFSSGEAKRVAVGASIDYVNAHRLDERPLEQLPPKRDRFALTARLNHRFGDSTLRLEERGYSDTWGLKASTTDVTYLYDISPRVALGPHARFHIQAPVEFWRLAYVSREGGADRQIPKWRTGDRDLGPLRGLTGGGLLTIAVGPRSNPAGWVLGLTGDCIWTKYTDDLYITDRISGFGALSLEAKFE
ncbi:MAG TPA: DUF3570 domain-containing protein [Byssovorax sp.]|jgi:hypothetical protein